MAAHAFGVFEIPENDHEQVIEVMGDAAAKLADSFQFLGSNQLFLDLL
jgi:hypothetical protein